MNGPEVSVVVPSHDRPVRLRWLLNALEEQTLDRSRFEVVVVHDSSGGETDALLRDHPLARDGTLRNRRLPPGSGKPSRQRNLGWGMARAPLIAFTDDDCRPHPRWLEVLLDAAAEHPGAVLQGATAPDPAEVPLLTIPHARSLHVDPPVPWGQTCNIAYPRELLQRLDGFDERLPAAAGEDTDLAMRAREAAAPYVGMPEARVWHAVSTPGFVGRLRTLGRWQHLVGVAKRHPGTRRYFPLGRFWRRSHALLPAALTGLVLARRRRPLALLALPWAIELMPPPGRPGLRGLAGRIRRLPGLAVIDAAEFLVMVRGSIRYRMLFL